MKLEELKALIDTATTDGEINHEELNKAINEKFDGLIAKKEQKAKDSAKDEHIAEFLSSEGFENIDQWKASINNAKGNETELSAKLTRLEGEMASITAERDTLKAQSEELGYMSKLGNVDDKFKKFVMTEVKGLVTDETDFDTALTSYLTDNAHYLKDNQAVVTKIPKTGNGSTPPEGVEAILAKKHNFKLE